MPFDPAAPLNDFSPAAACAAADGLRDLASQSPAGLLDQLGGQNFLNGIPSNLVDQFGPLLANLPPADMLNAINSAAGGLTDPAQLQQFMDMLPQDQLQQMAAGALGNAANQAAGAAGGAADALAAAVKNQIPAFLGQQIPNIPNLAQMAGLPSMPGMPAIPALPSIPGMPSLPAMPALPNLPGVPALPGIPGNLASLLPNLPNLAPPGLPFPPQALAGLVSGLAGQAAGLYQQAMNQIPAPPVPRIVPEDVPLPAPSDLTQSVASCAHTAAATHEDLVNQALATAPPLPAEVTEAMGGAEALADEFVGSMGEMANQLTQCPDIAQEAAGMMSLLGGPSVPLNDVTQGVQGMMNAFSDTAGEGMQSVGNLANTGAQLAQAAQQMPPEALSGLF
ncbi:MAG: hypothetical protein IT162_18065 [Bryobacterales bacterium]|nr:hypothetical protein [Bryobacterales bacterium]